MRLRNTPGEREKDALEAIPGALVRCCAKASQARRWPLTRWRRDRLAKMTALEGVVGRTSDG